MEDNNFISIWFIIGCLLLLFGIIIFAANLVDYIAPYSGGTVVLYNLHAGIWWGLLLIVIGAIYTIGFHPWKKQNDEA
ncbi:MAG TPA: hypothetical protein VK470_15875 [Bacteroidota bacterium]|nr:hypothetical protein [Bacteroidota bacterium]